MKPDVPGSFIIDPYLPRALTTGRKHLFLDNVKLEVDSWERDLCFKPLRLAVKLESEMFLLNMKGNQDAVR